MSESQFRKADSSVYTTFLDMIENVFPELSGYSFGLLYREQIKKSRGGMIMAEICMPNKLMSYFAKNDAGNPFDFLIIVDEMAWCCSKECDRIRLMRHELRHVNLSDKGVVGLIGHDFQDFYAECDLNADDPSWLQKLAEVVKAGYLQVKDGQKDPRTEHQDREDVVAVTKDPERQTKLPADVVEKMAKGAVDAIGKETEDKSKGGTLVYIGRGDDGQEVWEPCNKTPGIMGGTLEQLAKDRGLKTGASA